MCQSNPMLDDTRKIRDAFGSFPTGVAIVTTQTADGRQIGMTINSFSSISLSPQLISWCIDLRSSLYADFAHAEAFTVHILTEHQQPLARHFARPAQVHSSDVEFAQLQQPSTVCARFDCRNHQQILLGDHLMLIGEVDEFHKAEHAPLLFAGGRFQTLPAVAERSAA